MIAGSKSLATPRSVLTGLQPSFAKMGTNSPAAAMKALTSIRISGFDIKGHETDVSHERSDLTDVPPGVVPLPMLDIEASVVPEVGAF